MKTAVIFGHTSGLGLELSKMLLDEGYQVVGVARRKSKLDSKNVINLTADLSSEHDVEAIAARLRDQHSSFNLLAFCAGTLTSHAIDKLDYHEMERIFRVNVFAPMAIESRLFDLIKLNEADLLNVSSDSISNTYPSYHEYAASKVALQKFTRDLQQALKETNCRVIDFCTSGFQSNMRPNMTGEKAIRDEASYPTADEVAGLIVQLLKVSRKIEVAHVFTNRKTIKEN
jgi:short-subunit dehydrogenase